MVTQQDITSSFPRDRWFRQTAAFARRFVRELSRSWVGLFWTFGFPVMWYILTVHLGLLTPMATGAPGRFKAVLGISFGVFGAFTVALVGFTGDLAVDINAKRYRKFRSLPLRPSADIAGRFLAGLVLGLTSAFAMLAMAMADGATYVLPDTVGAVVAIASLTFFCLIGMVAGLAVTIVITDPRHATTVATGLLLAVFFATGYNGMVPSIFPLPSPWLNYLPNSLAARLLVRELVQVDWPAAGLSPPSIPADSTFVLLLGGYAIALTAVATVLTRSMIYQSDVGE